MKWTLFKNRGIYIIFILGFLLRALGVVNIELDGDFSFHWQIAGEIATGQNFPLLGPSASVNNDLHLGPFYFYFLALINIISGNNFKIAIILFSLINSFSIPFLYLAVKNLEGGKAATITAILYAFSSHLIQIQNFPWNPNLLPLLITLTLYLITRIKDNTKYLYLTVITIAILIQSHATSIFITPVFIIYLKKYFNWHTTLISVLILLISFTPWIIANVNNDFLEIKAIEKIFIPQSIEECNFQKWIGHHGLGERCYHYLRNPLAVLRFFSQALSNTRSISFSIVIFPLLFIGALKSKLKKRVLWFSWLAIPSFLYLFYSANIYPHYFLIYFPLPFMFFSSIILHRKFKDIGATFFFHISNI